MKRKLSRSRRREVRYEPLEPRVLLSADILPIEVDAQQAQAQADELIVDVDLDQVEEATRFVIEGLEPVDVPETIVTDTEGQAQLDATTPAEADGDDTEPPDFEPEPEAEPDAPETEPALVAAPAGNAQQILAAYWQEQQAVTVEARTEVQREVIVVDSAVEDHTALIEGLVESFIASQQKSSVDHAVEVVTETNETARPGAEQTVRIATTDDRTVAELHVVVLDSRVDGVDQLSDLLDGYDNLAALHLFAHGSSGALRLGASTVNSDSLARRAGQVKGWASAFRADGDILLYGCNVSEDGYGVRFTRALGDLTEADIASSDDVTG
ncbi:MAG: DUF4347 domain-containing protein, partial [Pseudomonadota bacterium]